MKYNKRLLSNGSVAVFLINLDENKYIEMNIAIDFDGTIVEHKYPEIGRPIPFAIETLLQLQKDNHKLILWTVREGDLLQEAVDYCEERGLYFYAINENYHGEDRSRAARKLGVDMFIDDRNLGGLPDWGVIYNAVQATVRGEDALQVMANSEIVEENSGKRSFLDLLRRR